MSFDRSSIRIGLNTDDKAKVVADDLKKRMKRIAATWRNECFEKMAIHPVHTTPNHRPSKMDVLPKNSVQIIIAVTSSIRPPSNSDDLGLLVCIYPSSMAEMLILGLSLSPKAKSKYVIEGKANVVKLVLNFSWVL